jgi:hypothetical protein
VGERLAVLLAKPLGLVAAVDEARERFAVEVQAGRAEDQRARSAFRRGLTQLIGQAGEVAQLDHFIARDRRHAEALPDVCLDRMSRRPDLLVAEVDTGEHDDCAVKIPRDVDATAEHAYSRLDPGLAFLCDG